MYDFHYGDRVRAKTQPWIRGYLISINKETECGRVFLDGNKSWLRMIKVNLNQWEKE